MTIKIDVMLYSYKNKNLLKVVESLLNNTNNDIFINIFDQHPLNRGAMFENDKIKYEHIYWDMTQSPCEYRGTILDKSEAEYILQISDDIIVYPEWDTELINFINKKPIVVSGMGNGTLRSKDMFSVEFIRSESDQFELTNYVDRNFIFASKEDWNCFKYPYWLKYNGEEEMISLELFEAKRKVYSLPYGKIQDLNTRTIDNLYTPFSKDHEYNSVVKTMNSRGRSFLEYHGVDITLKELPYPTDDVAYNPYSLSFQEIDARKFISTTKAIY